MGTDIHDGIEFRHPGTGTEYYDGEPWVAALDIWPLYDETDYAAFGCLFGVRNYAGFQPLAPGRGLPVDSEATRRVEWTTDELCCAYEPLTVGAALGHETHWQHVFAVMKALAGRFGDDGVRLVVAFD
ncbi:hypothetical protein [Streptomyces mirabilis]|uniref:hypothetical protein n=1 Tax=Streptomyces mirabilis TaxID=68239 RepID=UPI003683A7EB